MPFFNKFHSFELHKCSVNTSTTLSVTFLTDSVFIVSLSVVEDFTIVFNMLIGKETSPFSSKLDSLTKYIQPNNVTCSAYYIFVL